MLTGSENLEELSSEGNAISPGIIFLIGLGSIIVFGIIATLSTFLFLPLVRWMWKKDLKNQENQEKTTMESAK